KHLVDETKISESLESKVTFEEADVIIYRVSLTEILFSFPPPVLLPPLLHQTSSLLTYPF
ncbi:MAG TPA: hypothetical protein VIW25_09480, partial [Nitrososphaeraceae archaeon]